MVLARLGYHVTLVDLSKACLEFAKQKARENGVQLAGYEHLNATNLGGLKDQDYDAVLLMGPLYHLLSEERRRQAIRESYRILKYGGVIFAAFVTRYAPIRWMAKFEPTSEFYSDFMQTLDTGIWRANPRAKRFGCANDYFAHPNEIKPLMESEGFETLDVIGCEGVVSKIDERINELDDKAFDRWVELNYELGRDPSLHGAAEHILYIGSKQAKAGLYQSAGTYERK
jgi:ubiquinone/menaquinone biosynthesis C-methylase UbiE